MLETLLVMIVMCLLFFGLFQTVLVFQADEVLHHSAARAARAKSVGFNDWMVTKAQRVAAIPNSGKMLVPVLGGTATPSFDPNRTPGENWDSAIDPARAFDRSEKAVVELARIPEYLASDNYMRGDEILNYEEWENHSFSVSVQRTNPLAASLGAGGTVRASVRQRFPLLFPLHQLLYSAETDADGIDRITLAGESEILDHASLYLE